MPLLFILVKGIKKFLVVLIRLMVNLIRISGNNGQNFLLDSFLVVLGIQHSG